MGTILQKLADKAVWITLIVVFILGITADRLVLNPPPKTHSDTTYVHVAPPLPSTTTNTPAHVIPPKPPVQPDSTAIWQSTWLQNENATLHGQVDTLLARTDSLRAKLLVLLAPHGAVSTFDLMFADGKGWIKGTATQAYLPMKESFGLQLTPTDAYIPQITNTVVQPWWVSPAMAAGGGATVYFVTQKNTTGALISAGATILIYILEH